MNVFQTYRYCILFDDSKGKADTIHLVPPPSFLLGSTLLFVASLLLLFGLFVLKFLLSLGIGDGIRLDGKEGIHSRLRLEVGLVGDLQLFNAGLDAFRIEALLVHQKLHESFRIGFRPLELNIRGSFVVVEQSAGLHVYWDDLVVLVVHNIFVIVHFPVRRVVVIDTSLFVWHPVAGNDVFLSVQRGDNLLNGAVFADEPQTDAPNVWVRKSKKQSSTKTAPLLTRSWGRFL